MLFFQPAFALAQEANTKAVPVEFTAAENEKKVIDNDAAAEMFQTYMAKMRKDIKKNWSPPFSSFGTTTKVRFKLAKDGTLLYSELLVSSGDNELDRSALKAVRKTVFSPLPTQYDKDEVEVQFTFDYNNFSSEHLKTKISALLPSFLSELWRTKENDVTK